ncbi:MAG: hypothetical protein HXS44_08685 [Theionarchaea archaeon]|nr:hypothetical protein [Theionarchaea archaeon]
MLNWDSRLVFVSFEIFNHNFIRQFQEYVRVSALHKVNSCFHVDRSICVDSGGFARMNNWPRRLLKATYFPLGLMPTEKIVSKLRASYSV